MPLFEALCHNRPGTHSYVLAKDNAGKYHRIHSNPALVAYYDRRTRKVFFRILRIMICSDYPDVGRNPDVLPYRQSFKSLKIAAWLLHDVERGGVDIYVVAVQNESALPYREPDVSPLEEPPPPKIDLMHQT